MLPGERRGDSAARRALHEALLNEVGLHDVLERIAVFADGGGEVLDADGTARELLDDRPEKVSVDHVEAFGVDVEHLEGGRGHFLRDAAVVLHFGIIAHAPQKSVGDAGRAAAATGDFERARLVDADVEQARRAAHDAGELLGRVELQLVDDAEAGAQGICERACARRGTDEREGRQVDLDRTRGRTLADHDVDLVVLECGVEDFLNHRRETVDFVDEEDVVRLEVGEHGRQIAGTLENGPRGLAEIDAHFVRDDVG